MYKEISPDLVITDLSMPELCGCKTIEKIRQINADAKIIVMSGNSDLVCNHGKTIKDVSFLKKPFSIKDIEKVLKHFN